VVSQFGNGARVEARDQHEVLVRGLRKRAVIRTESFSRCVKEKTG
jgi:hypothetical protein